MGKVLVTTEAYREKRVANEIENMLAMRGIEVTTTIFEDFPGAIIVDSQEHESRELSRIMINTAHIRRVVKTIIPILYDTILEHVDYQTISVLVMEDFLPRVNLDVLQNSTFCVRCRFRGISGESRAERILGHYIKCVVPTSKVTFRRPQYVLLVETIGKWCGAYFGPNDTSILIYPEVQK